MFNLSIVSGYFAYKKKWFVSFGRLAMLRYTREHRIILVTGFRLIPRLAFRALPRK